MTTSHLPPFNAPNTRPHAPENFHLLVVDDDQKLRQLIGAFLKKKGFKISLAKDFTETRKTKINEFFKTIDKVLREYVENNSIDLVLNKKDILIGKNNYNITDEILKIVNELK